MKLHTVPLSLLFAATLVSAQNTIPWDATDLGPFHSACFKLKIGGADQVTAKGVAIKLGGADAKAAILFDTELLRWTAAWTGDFIQFPRGRGGLEGQTKPAGIILFSTGYAPVGQKRISVKIRAHSTKATSRRKVPNGAACT
jgi:hypothetical protein